MSTPQQISPIYEYTMADYTITAKGSAGLYQIAPGRGKPGPVEDFNYDGKPKSETVKGSGVNPRAHTRTINEPEAELTLPVDWSTSFEKFVVKCGGVVDMIYTRQAPGASIAITDIAKTWKPLFGGNSGKSGSAQFIKITGKALEIQKDVKDVIT